MSARAEVLRELAERAVADRGFLRAARVEPRVAFAENGYDLNDDELRLIEEVRRRTAGMGDADVARTLAHGLAGIDASPARPAPPGPRGLGPSKPARPGR